MGVRFERGRGRGTGTRDDHYLWFFPAGRDYTVTALNMSRDGKPRVKPSFEKNLFFWVVACPEDE